MSIDETQLLQLLASVEKASEHPLAAAIIDGAMKKKIELVTVTEFQSVTGKGVTGTVRGSRIGVGSAALRILARHVKGCRIRQKPFETKTRPLCF